MSEKIQIELDQRRQLVVDSNLGSEQVSVTTETTITKDAAQGIATTRNLRGNIEVLYAGAALVEMFALPLMMLHQGEFSIAKTIGAVAAYFAVHIGLGLASDSHKEADIYEKMVNTMNKYATAKATLITTKT